jgi:hypothetical protein
VKRFLSLQFLNFRQSVGLLGLVISPTQGRYLTQTQNKSKHLFPEWDSNPRSSVRASEDSLGKESLFIVRTIWNTQIDSLGRMQSFGVLEQVVHIVTTGLY